MRRHGWLPDIDGRVSYRAIVRALGDDISNGRIRPGDRLPPVRELAFALGVAVGTVSKAYADAARRGLVSSEVGRGTFAIRQMASLSQPSVDPGIIDLAFNTPVLGDVHIEATATTLGELCRSEDLGALWGYHRPWIGRERFRQAGAAWLASRGYDVSPDRVVLVSGAQHAAAVVLNCLTQPGDIVLSEALTDPGRKALMANRNLVVKGLPTDEEGLLPAAVDEACRTMKVRVLYCMSNHHSPTLGVMSDARRRAIAEIAVRYDVAIIENDVYGPLVDSPPPVSSFAPNQSFYISSLSKTVAPALRIGYLAVPPGRAAEMTPGLVSTAWMAPSIPAEIASRWILTGTAERLIEWQRRQLASRNSIAAAALDGLNYVSLPTGMHIWLHLPDQWDSAAFASEARSRGLTLAPSEDFLVGRLPAPRAVRVSLGGSVESERELRQGLESLAAIARTTRSMSEVIM